MKVRNYIVPCAFSILIAVTLMSVGVDAYAWQVNVKNETKYRADVFVAVNVFFGSAYQGHKVIDLAPGASGVVDTGGYCPGAIGANVYMDYRDTQDPWLKSLDWVCSLTFNPGMTYCTATCWNISVSVKEESPGNFRIIKR